MTIFEPTASQPLPRVTVAIPVYNSETTLARCLRSVTQQTLRDIEILVADDCSTDSSVGVAEAMALDDSRIRVIRLSPNGGKPRAMNVMIAEARGQWVAVLDADDAYHPQRLERLVDAAERLDVQMVADNIFYIDAGIDQIVRTGFDIETGPRIICTKDLLDTTNTFASFDYGILKPMVRRDFLLTHGLTYYEHTRLAEDFYYLLNFFVAGGRACLLSEPMYYWTLPFGTISRKWTGTGNGAWRYDYRQALQANQYYITKMIERNEMGVVAMLQARSHQYKAMIHYLDAQRLAADRNWLRCAKTILAHPCTYRLLLGRIIGRLGRRLIRPKYLHTTSFQPVVASSKVGSVS
jgi:succinoglycan biosynthesis protein ExoO